MASDEKGLTGAHARVAQEVKRIDAYDSRDGTGLQLRNLLGSDAYEVIDWNGCKRVWEVLVKARAWDEAQNTMGQALSEVRGLLIESGSHVPGEVWDVLNAGLGEDCTVEEAEEAARLATYSAQRLREIGLGDLNTSGAETARHGLQGHTGDTIEVTYNYPVGESKQPGGRGAIWPEPSWRQLELLLILTEDLGNDYLFSARTREQENITEDEDAALCMVLIRFINDYLTSRRTDEGQRFAASGQKRCAYQGSDSTAHQGTSGADATAYQAPSHLPLAHASNPPPRTCGTCFAPIQPDESCAHYPGCGFERMVRSLQASDRPTCDCALCVVSRARARAPFPAWQDVLFVPNPLSPTCDCNLCQAAVDLQEGVQQPLPTPKPPTTTETTAHATAPSEATQSPSYEDDVDFELDPAKSRADMGHRTMVPTLYPACPHPTRTLAPHFPTGIHWDKDK